MRFKQFNIYAFPHDVIHMERGLQLDKNHMKMRFYLEEYKTMCNLVNRDLGETAQ
jgi:hypothetical protein